MASIEDLINGYIESRLSLTKEADVLRGRILAYEVIEKTITNELAQLRNRYERITQCQKQ